MGVGTAGPEGRRPGPHRLPLAERVRRRDQQSDLMMLVVALAVVVASMVLTPSETVLTLFGWEVPPLCVFRNVSGQDCPGCGLTRSFTYMGHLDVRAAFGRHVLGPVLYVAVAAQVPLRAWRLWERRQPVDGDGPSPTGG